MPSIKNIKIPLFILAILFVHILVNYHILSGSRIFPRFDDANRIFEGLSCYHGLNLGVIKGIKSHLILGPIQFHPPLLRFIHAFCWWFLEIFNSGNINSVIILSNALFLLVLLISVYGIGSILYSRSVGLLSAFLISMFPLVFGHSRIAMLEFPLTSVASLTVFLLLKSKHFSLLSYSLLAGAVFGLAEITKEAAIIFIAPPFIYYLLKSRKLVERHKFIRNLFFFLLAFGIIAGTVYLRKGNSQAFYKYWQLIRYNSQNINVNSGYFRYYFLYFPRIMGHFILIISLPLIFGYLINIKQRERILFYWFVIPFILFNLSLNTTIRFILPLSVPFCLIFTQELFSNPLFKKIKAWYIIILVIAAMLQYVLINSGLIMKNALQYPQQGLICIKKDDNYHSYIAFFEIFKKEVQGVSLNYDSNKKVVFLSDMGVYSWYLKVNFLLYRMPFTVLSPRSALPLDSGLKEPLKMKIMQEQIFTADYIVDMDRDKIVKNYAPFTSARESHLFDISKEKFTLIGTVKLVDGASILVYKRI